MVRLNIHKMIKSFRELHIFSLYCVPLAELNNMEQKERDRRFAVKCHLGRWAGIILRTTWMMPPPPFVAPHFQLVSRTSKTDQASIKQARGPSTSFFFHVQCYVHLLLSTACSLDLVIIAACVLEFTRCLY